MSMALKDPELTDKEIQQRLDEMQEEDIQRILKSDLYKDHLNCGFRKIDPLGFCSEFDVLYFSNTYNEERRMCIPLAPKLRSYQLAKNCLEAIKKIVPTAVLGRQHCFFTNEEENNPNRQSILGEIVDNHAVVPVHVSEAVEYWKHRIRDRTQ